MGYRALLAVAVVLMVAGCTGTELVSETTTIGDADTGAVTSTTTSTFA